MPFFGGGGGGGGDYLILSHGNINGAGAGAMPLLTGTNDMALGVGALNAVTTGSSNVVVGDAAASNLVDGDNNVVIGNSAGLGLVSTGGILGANVIIGVDTVPTYDTSDSVVIGPYADVLTGAGLTVAIGVNAVGGEQSVTIGAGAAIGGINPGLNSIAIGNLATVTLDDATFDRRHCNRCAISCQLLMVLQ